VIATSVSLTGQRDFWKLPQHVRTEASRNQKQQVLNLVFRYFRPEMNRSLILGFFILFPGFFQGFAIEQIPDGTPDMNLSSDPRAFRVSADDMGFMCPFLTPIFKERLFKSGAAEVIQKENLDIVVAFPASHNFSAEDIIALAGAVGYDPATIHVESTEWNP